MKKEESLEKATQLIYEKNFFPNTKFFDALYWLLFFKQGSLSEARFSQTNKHNRVYASAGKKCAFTWLYYKTVKKLSKQQQTKIINSNRIQLDYVPWK